MKEKIFKNLSLKILSLALAAILWTVIVNIYDPTMSYTFSNVTVNLINTESLTDNNYSYEVVGGGKISVYVSGPKSVITDIKASDIVATADLSKVSAFADYVDISVQVVKDGQTLTTVEATPKTSALKLNIENRDTKTININAKTTGTTASGYSVISEKLNPASVKVTGPSSVIDSVSEAVITYDVTGASDDLYGNAPIILYDSEGNVVEDDAISLSVSSVDYQSIISRTKVVPVNVSASGTPANGYVLSGLDQSITKVTIAGTTADLNNISSITIPDQNINVSGLSNTKVFKFTLSNYVDSNITILSEAALQVTAKIEPLSTKMIVYNTSNITVKGLDNTLNVTYPSETCNLSIKGGLSTLNNIDTSLISVTLDLSSYTGTGSQNVKATVKLPDGYTLDEDCYVSVVLTQAN